MSITSENRRVETLTQKQQELSGQDRYKARVAERDVGRLAKVADPLADVKIKEQKEADNLSGLAEVDDYSKYLLNPDYHKLATFVELPTADFEDGLETMKFLMEWGKEVAKSDDILKILGAVKGLKKAYGFKEVGLSGLRKLYMYARLDADERRIQAERKLLK